MAEFQEFKKIPRLSRLCTITEKIDGTNGVIYIGENGEFQAGSRSRWLLKLGPGYHYGEWWGLGIQRNYSIKEKRFSLFNTFQWSDALGLRPACCSVVPVLWEGIFHTPKVWEIIDDLQRNGSIASPGFMQPEGIVIYHQAAKQYFKKTVEKDEAHKGE